MTSRDTIAYAIKKELSFESLKNFCDSWGFTIKEFEEFLEDAVKAEKYRWHDLLKNPNDLPDKPIQVEVFGINYHYAHAKYGRFYDRNSGEYHYEWVRFDAWSANEVLKDVLRWRYIEGVES